MIHIDNDLLKEFRQLPCEWCGELGESDPHHLYCRQIGGGNRLDIRLNLVSLCRICHIKAEANQIPREELCKEAIKRDVWHFQRMPKEAHERFAKIMADLNQLMRDYP